LTEGETLSWKDSEVNAGANAQHFYQVLRER